MYLFELLIYVFVHPFVVYFFSYVFRPRFLYLLAYLRAYLLTYLLTCVLIIEPSLINLCVWVRACVHRLAPLWGNGSSSVQPVLSGMSQACRESLSESRVL